MEATCKRCDRDVTVTDGVFVEHGHLYTGECEGSRQRPEEQGEQRPRPGDVWQYGNVSVVGGEMRTVESLYDGVVYFVGGCHAKLDWFLAHARLVTPAAPTPKPEAGAA